MKKLFLSLVILLLIGSNASAVMIDGKDWRQLTETIFTSWDDLASIYNTATGMLKDENDTEILGRDFDGWIWASSVEVAAMYSSFEGLTISSGEDVIEAMSDWAPEYLQMMSHTYWADNAEGAIGITRDEDHYGDDWGHHSSAIMMGTASMYDSDRAYVAMGFPRDSRSSFTGAFMYRGSAPVPEPATMLLFGTGLVCLAGISIRRRKRQR